MDNVLTYTIHLEPADEGGYTVTVPAIPAIVTEGDSYEHAIAMAEDAIQLYIEHCTENGLDVPVDTGTPVPLSARVNITASAST